MTPSSQVLRATMLAIMITTGCLIIAGCGASDESVSGEAMTEDVDMPAQGSVSGESSENDEWAADAAEQSVLSNDSAAEMTTLVAEPTAQPSSGGFGGGSSGGGMSGEGEVAGRRGALLEGLLDNHQSLTEAEEAGSGGEKSGGGGEQVVRENRQLMPSATPNGLEADGLASPGRNGDDGSVRLDSARGLKTQESRVRAVPQEKAISETRPATVEEKQPQLHRKRDRFSLDVLDGITKGLAESRLKQKKVMQLDLQAGEELWIIAKATEPATRAAHDTPGSGALMATVPGQPKQIPVPLKHTSVTGDIDGYIATVDVTQQFHNPFDSKIEAVYVFPLPHSAAVNEFIMTVGDRRIRGIIREREKAEQIYAAAKARGHVASLMTQERANIFTQKVANIEPGKQIDINIRYFNTLQYDDGAYEFVFPMVVGPRFNPAATTDSVGAVARGAVGASGQTTEVPYLAPDERSGHDISLSLNISAGVDIEDIHSVNHGVDIKSISDSGRHVTLAAHDTIPNRDFVLRYKVAGDQIKTAMLTHEDKHGKYFTMMLYPPADLEQVNRSPMEMVFVLDCSGSMKGQPIAQAKAAISHALLSLTPRDTFQIIRFSNNASQLGPEPVPATEANIQKGLAYLTSLNSTGGTHMIEGIKAALDFPHDEGRFRLVSFMTDGYIGNEQQILSTMYDKLGASRVFSFGVGNSTNRMLMNRMAILGRGAATYLSLNDDAVEIMDRFNRRISHPAMTDLSIDWGNMRVADVYPQRIPDLIVGRPVVLTGRFKGEPDTVKVNGRVDMEATSFEVSLADDGVTDQHQGIAAVWARLKIRDMMNVATHAPEAADEIRSAVTQTALAYSLMSSYTSFVAVDSLTKTEGDYGTTVAVPVPVPEGVKYETTVGGRAETVAN